MQRSKIKNRVEEVLLKNLPYQLIVGADFFQEWRIRLDPEREDFIIDEQRLKEGLIVTLNPS